MGIFEIVNYTDDNFTLLCYVLFDNDHYVIFNRNTFEVVDYDHDSVLSELKIDLINTTLKIKLIY